MNELDLEWKHLSDEEFAKFDLTCIEKLYCSGNYLTTFPQGLPVGLKELYCNDNNLDDFGPNGLPDTLVILECDNNDLETLGKIPNSLRMLSCTDNPNLKETITVHKNCKIYADDELLLHNLHLFDSNVFKDEIKNRVKDTMLQEMNGEHTFDSVRKQYEEWLYRPGGEQYKKCEQIVETLQN